MSPIFPHIFFLQAGAQSLLIKTTREIGCQTDPPERQKRTVGTQLSLRTLQPHFKSEGT